MVKITDQKCVTGTIIYAGRTTTHATPWGELFFRGQKIVALVHGHTTRKTTMYIRADTRLALMHIPRHTLRQGRWEFQVHGESLHTDSYHGIIFIDDIRPMAQSVNVVKLSNYFD